MASWLALQYRFNHNYPSIEMRTGAWLLLSVDFPVHCSYSPSIPSQIHVHMDVPHCRRIYPALPPPSVVQVPCGVRGYSSDLDLRHMAVLGGRREHREQVSLSAGRRESVCLCSVLHTDSGSFRCVPPYPLLVWFLCNEKQDGC